MERIIIRSIKVTIYKTGFLKNNNKILITGGATGIGLGLAERFLNVGNTVIICGRRQEALNEAQAKFPALIPNNAI